MEGCLCYTSLKAELCISQEKNILLADMAQ